MKHIYICSHCGEKDINLLMHAARSKDGRTQYYCCRACNTERSRRYRRTKKGRKISYDAVYRSIKKYPKKHSARVRLCLAIKKGKIKRPGACQDCGVKCKPDGHHEDYSKPFEVIWVCGSCHRIRDKNMVI